MDTPQQTIDDTEPQDELELDENDNKIIQLYEVINELIDEQKSRVGDIELLYHDQTDLVLTNIETRNNSLLNQIFTELELTEKEEEEEEDESDTDEEEDSEDEQDQGWEIYNTVVNNLNQYMGHIALLTQKLRETREMIDTMEVPQEMQEQELKELETVVEAQTNALEAQMKRNEELESALSSVLGEYSSRISDTNKEVAALHQQISTTNAQHAHQLAELRQMYEQKIQELQQTQDSQYKEEVLKLIDSLSASRSVFQKQILELTNEMNEAQTNHHREMLTMTDFNQKLSEALAEKTRLVEELKRKQYNRKSSKPQLQKTRTQLDIDDDEEFFYSSHSNGSSKYTSSSPHSLNIDKQASTLPNGGKKTRTFTPSGYTNSSMNNNANNTQNSSNNMNNARSKQHVSNGNAGPSSGSALQAKYARYKTQSRSRKVY